MKTLKENKIEKAVYPIMYKVNPETLSDYEIGLSQEPNSSSDSIVPFIYRMFDYQDRIDSFLNYHYVNGRNKLLYLDFLKHLLGYLNYEFITTLFNDIHEEAPYELIGQLINGWRKDIKKFVAYKRDEAFKQIQNDANDADENGQQVIKELSQQHREENEAIKTNYGHGKEQTLLSNPSFQNVQLALIAKILKNARLIDANDKTFEVALRNSFKVIHSDTILLSDNALLVVKLLYYLQERRFIVIERDVLRDQIIESFSVQQDKVIIRINKGTVRNIFLDSRDNKARPRLKHILNKLERLASDKSEMKTDLRSVFPIRF